MKKLLIAAAMTLALSGCAELQNAWNAATGATVSPSIVIVAVNSFDALEATATNYLRLPKCNSTNGPICRSSAATAQIIPAVRAGRIARNNLEAFLNSHPGALAPQGLYDALSSAVNTLQAVIAQYNIKVN